MVTENRWPFARVCPQLLWSQRSDAGRFWAQSPSQGHSAGLPEYGLMGAGQRVVELNLILPPPPVLPAGVSVPFDWVRVRGTRVLVSGHGALDSQGAPAGPFGSVPTEVSLAQARAQHERQRSPYWRPFSDR